MSNEINSINNISKRMSTLESKMELILEKLEKIDKLDNINDNCEKMGNHINFIEAVYETVRAPLQYISNTFVSNTEALPYKDDINKMKSNC